MAKYRPILFLFLAAPLIPEVFVSGNTKFQQLLNPINDFFLILAYGPPILLIREFYVRYRLQTVALLMLGLSYGIFNEGILAHTLTQVTSELIGNFAGYGMVYGLQSGWATLILTWHAIFSVFLPVSLTHYLFPEVTSEAWIGKKGLWGMGVILVMQLPLYFMIGSERSVHPVELFVLYLVFMTFITALAYRVGRRAATHPISTYWTFHTLTIGGFLLPTLIYILAFLAPAVHVPVLLYTFIGWGLFVWLIYYIYSRQISALPHLLVFVLAASMTFSFCWMWILSNIFAPVYLLLGAILLRRVRKEFPAS